jgi:ectoine hydroxylase-related dioxygenase (phytanoyl-CoA dioxygenase family)
MTAHCALPAARFGPQRTERWHRDIDVFDPARHELRYLWFFVCLDDFTADNGATWAVPGSQRIPSLRNLPDALPGERYPTRVQLLARAGDLIALDPSTLHTVGHNGTDRPRRMLNVSVCRSDVRPILDHWSIAGPAVHARASATLRGMLAGERERPPDATWTVLPEGWQTSPVRAEDYAGERVFAEEQRESFQPRTLSRRED